MTLAGKVELANRLAQNNLITPEEYISFLDETMDIEKTANLLYKLFILENGNE